MPGCGKHGREVTSLVIRVRAAFSASIAQWLEHWSCKPGVVSSILTGGCHIFALMLVDFNDILVFLYKAFPVFVSDPSQDFLL